jgi:hypothetical protein
MLDVAQPFLANSSITSEPAHLGQHVLFVYCFFFLKKKFCKKQALFAVK